MRLGSLTALALCALTGGLLALCYPPFSQGWLAWFALAPWLWVVWNATRRLAVLGSWLAGFTFFAALMSWIAFAGYDRWTLLIWLWLLLSALESLAFVVAALLIRSVRTRSWRAALTCGTAWVVSEWFRSLSPFGLTWGQLGYSQSAYLPIVQWASVGGVSLISFTIMVWNAALAQVVGRRTHQAYLRVAVIAIIVVAMLYAGARRVANVGQQKTGTHGSGIQIAVIQASAIEPLHVSQLNQPWTEDEQDRELRSWEQLTRQAAVTHPCLVVWSESAIPGFLDSSPQLFRRIVGVARQANAYLLAGGPYEDSFGQLFNSAFLIGPRGNQVWRYDKVHLVPFAEYVPGRSWLPLLKHYTVREQDLKPGPGHGAFPVGSVKVGPMICFESIFPEIARREVKLGAQILVIITNDAWFGRTAAAEQHAQMSVFRAVETGTWVLRCAGTGISMIISPEGRVRARADLFKRKVLVARVSTAPITTWHQRRRGFLFPFAMLALWGVLFSLGLRRARADLMPEE